MAGSAFVHMISGHVSGVVPERRLYKVWLIVCLLLTAVAQREWGNTVGMYMYACSVGFIGVLSLPVFRTGEGVLVVVR